MAEQPYDFYKTLAKPSLVAEGRQTNFTSTLTIPAATSPIGGAIYITRITISASAAPATAVEATLTGLPGGVTLHIEIPALAFAPITFGDSTHPLQCAVNTPAVFTLPALGAGVIGSVQVYYYYAP